MRHRTPLQALETLGREVVAMCGDVGLGGAAIARRIDEVGQMLRVIGSTLHVDPTVDPEAVSRQLEQMLKDHEALTESLRQELGRIGAELAQLRTGATATASYGTIPLAGRRAQLDLVG